MIHAADLFIKLWQTIFELINLHAGENEKRNVSKLFSVSAH